MGANLKNFKKMVALLVLLLYSYNRSQQRQPKKTKVENKMKLKNLANYTNQELQDVLTQAKAYLQLDEFDFTMAALVNYQEQEEDGTTYYEVYESTLFIEQETTLEEMQEMQIDKEQLVKTYKTKRGLLQAMLNDKDVAGNRYRIHTVL